MMTSRIFKYILLVPLLAGLNFVYIGLAQENNNEEGLINRPQVKYKSAQLRDPFQSYLVKEEKPLATTQDASGKAAQPKAKLGTLIVQGIIWGGKIPQAIINDKVLLVGDMIEGAQILSIDKNGITLNFSGEIITLSAPGEGIIPKKKIE